MAATTISTTISKTQPNLSSLSSKNNQLNFSAFSSNVRFRKASNFAAKCCLNLPLEVKTDAGKSLSSIIQNQPQSFYDAVSLELNRVSEDRDAAFARFNLSLGSSEASLHRRIAELKEAECQLAVEDVLYMMILYKFSEIRVPLVPSLSKCLYNGRLEILPSKDSELESIHNDEILEMVREHLSVSLGWKVGSSVTVNWSPTKIRRNHLRKVYSSSILYGYFLKSASMRLRLENSLPSTYRMPFGNWTPLPEHQLFGSENITLGHMVTPTLTSLSQVTRPVMKKANLRSYVMGFDMDTMKECAKLKSEEVVELIDKHCLGLFGNEDAVSNDMILTSMASLKRLVLEAVAFGGFLWDAEDCVKGMYKLRER